MLMQTGEFSMRRDGALQERLRDRLVAILPPAARIAAHGWRPWASASFAGARHWFDVRPRGEDDPATMARRLERHIWAVRGCFVADVAVHLGDASGGDWRIELLTVDD